MKNKKRCDGGDPVKTSDGIVQGIQVGITSAMFNTKGSNKMKEYNTAREMQADLLKRVYEETIKAVEEQSNAQDRLEILRDAMGCFLMGMTKMDDWFFV